MAADTADPAVTAGGATLAGDSDAVLLATLRTLATSAASSRSSHLLLDLPPAPPDLPPTTLSAAALATDSTANTTNINTSSTTLLLRSHLSDALADLRKKERDLELAAEIGQHLVAVNASLMQEYQDLLARSRQQQQQQQQQQTLRSRGSISSIRQRRRPSLASLAGNGDGQTATSADLLAKDSIDRRRSLTTTSLTTSEQQLTAQLQTLSANLADSERMHAAALTNLRATNEHLQTQLAAALRDLRAVETISAEAVARLEAQLESAREDLALASAAACELADDRRRVLAQAAQTRREHAAAQAADAELISELQRQIVRLEASNAHLTIGKRDAERRSWEQSVELEVLAEAARGMEDMLAQVDRIKQQSIGQQNAIRELSMQLEDVRDRDAEAAEEAAALSCSSSSEDESDSALDVSLTSPPPAWDWTSWLARALPSAGKLDVSALRSDLADLAAHRNDAYARLQTALRAVQGGIEHRTPAPVAAALGLARSVVPSPVADLAGALARGARQGLEARLDLGGRISK
ncbi:hypothetical protein BDZ88DRAFT_402896 [Geranomyces variabilis]|nr:hypothetical protein BDZ88DRAFT_402896 [Geranomyces variabilis]KAJ3143070.1 hypothetical protein HDU90_002944 [Geranomyces variabilis]